MPVSASQHRIAILQSYEKKSTGPVVHSHRITSNGPQISDGVNDFGRYITAVKNSQELMINSYDKNINWRPCKLTTALQSMLLLSQLQPVCHQISAPSAIPVKTSMLANPTQASAGNALTGRYNPVDSVTKAKPLQFPVVDNFLQKENNPDAAREAPELIFPDMTLANSQTSNNAVVTPLIMGAATATAAAEAGMNPFLSGTVGFVVGALFGGLGIKIYSNSRNEACMQSGQHEALSAVLVKHEEMKPRALSYRQENPLNDITDKISKKFMESCFEESKVNVTTFDMEALKTVSPAQYSFIMTAVENTKTIVAAALQQLLPIINRINPVVKTSFTDEEFMQYYYDAAINAIGPNAHNHYPNSSSAIDFLKEKKSALPHQEFPDDEGFYQDLFIALSKIMIYIEKVCDGDNNNCVNFMTGRYTHQSKSYEKQNNLTQLYALAGNGITKRYGENKMHVGVTSNFFSTNTVDSARILFHELLHGVTATADLFEIKRNSDYERLPTSTYVEMPIPRALEKIENALNNTKNTIGEVLYDKWTPETSFAVTDLLNKISPTLVNEELSKHRDHFIARYKDDLDFRRQVNARNTDSVSSLVFFLANQHFKGMETLPLQSNAAFREKKRTY
ncbi:hypothetical protein [Izhakiella australiensis]|nr:hypothetical protein [Izhakiella australiensis]